MTLNLRMTNNWLILLKQKSRFFLLAFLFLGTIQLMAQAPTVSQAPMDVTMDAYGSGTGTFNDWIENFGFGVVTPAEECGTATYSNNYDQDNWNYGCSSYDGSVSVTFTYQDECDNVLAWTRTFTFFDETSPSCIKNGDLELDCSSPDTENTLANWLAFQGTVTDLSHPITITNDFSGNLPGAGCMAENGTVVTWTFTDACGNSTSNSAVLTLVDTEAPMLTVEASDQSIDCVSSASLIAYDIWLNNAGGASVTDNCSGITWTNDATGTPSCNVPSVVTFTASDACGNSVSTTASFSMNDNEGPTLINVPADLETTCDNIPTPANVEVVDNCTLAINPEFSESIAGDLAACETDGVVITRTWTATDECGNVTVETQVITVTSVPSEITITPPTDLSLDCTDIVTMDPADATTTCPEGGLSISESEEITPMGCPGSYTLIRTFTATDACGNTATATQTITVLDMTPPVFSFVPGHTDVGCEGYPDGFGDVGVGEACGTFELTFVDVLEEYICDADFNITRIWTATDECGNTSTASQTLTVWPDIEAPTFTFIPGDLTITCPAEPEFGTPEVIDNCTDMTITDNTTANGSCPDGYTTTRTWTAIDACGNASTASQTITVLATPNELEFVYIPENKTISCGATSTFGTPICNGTCIEGYTMSSVDSQAIGDCSSAKISTRTWTATDVCGNSISCSQTITSIDNTAPNFSNVEADKVITCNEAIEFSMPSALDACSAVTVTFDDLLEWNSCEGMAYTTTRTWTAIDACGNASEASQTIAIAEDIDAPVFSNTISDKIITCNEAIEFDEPNVTDNCTIQTFTHADETINTTCETMITRTWTAVDGCDNVSTKTQTISIIDEEKPVFNINNQVIQLSAIQAANYTVPNVLATDECSNVVVEGPNVFNYNETETNYTWTAIDDCGNKKSVSIKVQIIDNDLPEGTLEVTNGFSIYPNPTSGQMTINFESDNGGKANIEIYDLLGKIHHTTSTTAVKGFNSTGLNMSELPIGTYVLKVINGKEELTQRFVKF